MLAGLSLAPAVWGGEEAVQALAGPAAWAGEGIAGVGQYAAQSRPPPLPWVGWASPDRPATCLCSSVKHFHQDQLASCETSKNPQLVCH